MKKLIISLLLFSNIALGNNVVLQHGGELGTAVLGYGFNYKIYRAELLYGYHKELETFALRNSFAIFDYKKIFINLGFSIYHAELRDIPRRGYKKGYYEQSINQRAYLFYNIEYKENQHGVYFENGINDVNAEAYYNNDLSLNDLMSIGIGYRFYFDE